MGHCGPRFPLVIWLGVDARRIRRTGRVSRRGLSSLIRVITAQDLAGFALWLNDFDEAFQLRLTEQPGFGAEVKDRAGGFGISLKRLGDLSMQHRFEVADGADLFPFADFYRLCKDLFNQRRDVGNRRRLRAPFRISGTALLELAGLGRLAKADRVAARRRIDFCRWQPRR